MNFSIGVRCGSWLDTVMCGEIRLTADVLWLAESQPVRRHPQPGHGRHDRSGAVHRRRPAGDLRLRAPRPEAPRTGAGAACAYPDGAHPHQRLRQRNDLPNLPFRAPVPRLLLRGSLFPELHCRTVTVDATYAARRAAGVRTRVPLRLFRKEQVNYFSHGEVAASRFVYGVAPRGSLIIGETSNFPWAFMNYEFYDYMRFGLFLPDDRKAILADPVGMFRDMMSGRHHAYLIITRSQIADVEMIGAMPQGSVARLVQILMSSPEFTVILHNPDAIVFTLAQPALEHSS